MQEEILPQLEEVEQVPQDSQGEQVPIVDGGDDFPEFSNRDIESLCLL